MPRPGRIRASAPPLICSTRISWHDCGARITSCSPARKYPAPATQARTLVIPSTTSSTWVKYKASAPTKKWLRSDSRRSPGTRKILALDLSHPGRGLPLAQIQWQRTPVEAASFVS